MIVPTVGDLRKLTENLSDDTEIMMVFDTREEVPQTPTGFALGAAVGISRDGTDVLMVEVESSASTLAKL